MSIPSRTYLETAPEVLRLKTSHLLYKADILLKKQKIDEDWIITAKGVLRVGPKNGSVETRSHFNKEKNYWESGTYKISGFPVEEKFFKTKNFYIVKTSSENQVPFDPAIEELVALMFFIYQNRKTSWTVTTILGGKPREIVSDRGLIFLKKKKWAEVKETSKGLEIKVIPLRMKFNLSDQSTS